MYFSAALHGQRASLSLAGAARQRSAAPSRTRHPVPSRPSTFVPTRVMMCMFATTYGESVISTPSLAIGESSGPMQYGMTYMVRPAMQPAKSWFSFAFILAGSSQLLVGPASAGSVEQINVRSSTRATSPGLERTKRLFGFFPGFSGMALPCCTMRRAIWLYSRLEPSQRCMRSGWHRSATSSIQRTSSGWRIFAIVFVNCCAIF